MQIGTISWYDSILMQKRTHIDIRDIDLQAIARNSRPVDEQTAEKALQQALRSM